MEGIADQARINHTNVELKLRRISFQIRRIWGLIIPMWN
mgnify:CR=1 FL=1